MLLYMVGGNEMEMAFRVIGKYTYERFFLFYFLIFLQSNQMILSGIFRFKSFA